MKGSRAIAGTISEIMESLEKSRVLTVDTQKSYVTKESEGLVCCHVVLGANMRFMGALEPPLMQWNGGVVTRGHNNRGCYRQNPHGIYSV